MDFLRDLARSTRHLLAALRRPRLDDELRDEIRHHLELRERQLIDEGMDPRTAAAEARRIFGNPMLVRERTRDVRSFPRLDALTQDLRFGVRLLLQSPLFSLVAILSLAAGIATAVAVFTMADAVMFRKLPVRNPEQLRSFRIEMRAGGALKTVPGVPEAAVQTIQNGADFADFVGFRTSDDVALSVDGDRSARLSRVEFVTANYFRVLGVGSIAGRVPGDSDALALPVPLVISERLWRSIAGDDNAVGRAVSLNGQPAVVIGLTRNFSGLTAERPVDVFAPLASGRVIDPSQANFVVRLVGRLHEGVSPAVAEQKLAALYPVAMPGPTAGARIEATMPDASRGVSDARIALERPLRLSLALVAVLVIISCSNTGGLLLSRFAARRAEFGVRVAIGAGRSRLAMQLMAETLVVAIVAAAVGLLVGWIAAPLLLRSMPETGSQVAFELRLDRRLLLFTGALTLLCALGTVAAPLARLWRQDASQLLSSESRTVSAGSRRITRLLIGGQVACSLLLIVAAVSMARSITHLRSVPLGFDPARLFVVSVNATGLRAPSEMSAFHQALHERIAASPGVGRASMAQLGVLTSSSTVGTVTVPGFTPVTDDDRISRIFFVGPDYFETLGIPIVAGRPFGSQDVANRAAITIVNERFANDYFGSTANAVDRVINGDVRIVGVAADARLSTPRDRAVRAMFVPYARAQRPSMAHIVRADGETTAAMLAVAGTVSAFDARLRPKIATVEELLDTALARERFFGVVAWVLAAVAVMLACSGLYAAVAFAVAQRRAEIAIRSALGARPGDVLLLVLRDPLIVTIAGIAAGLPGAYIVLRSMAALLFGVRPFDAATMAVCGIALILCALLAALLPARRALGIDATSALRSS